MPATVSTVVKNSTDWAKMFDIPGVSLAEQGSEFGTGSRTQPDPVVRISPTKWL